MPSVVFALERLAWNALLLWLSPLAEGLASRGWSVTIAARQDGPARHHCWRRGITLTHLPPLAIGLPRPSAWQHLLRSQDHPSIVQSCDLPSHLWTRLLAPSKFKSPPAYSAIYLDHLPDARYWGLALRYLHSRDVAILTPFRYIADQLRSRGFSPQKIVLIPLRIQVPHISPKELTDLRAAWHFPDACKLIVAMVTSNQQDEIKTLLWAMDILRHAHPNVHLAVLTSNSHHHPSETLAHQFGLTAHTTFAGAPHDLMLWIALADIVWLSSETGCAWFYALSALALGKPVIVPQTPIFQEIIERGEGAFLTRPQDPVALARCTLACLETCCSASGFANAVRQKVAPMLNFDDCLQAYQDFYSRILAERVS